MSASILPSLFVFLFAVTWIYLVFRMMDLVSRLINTWKKNFPLGGLWKYQCWQTIVMKTFFSVFGFGQLNVFKKLLVLGGLWLVSRFFLKRVKSLFVFSPVIIIINYVLFWTLITGTLLDKKGFEPSPQHITEAPWYVWHLHFRRVCLLSFMLIVAFVQWIWSLTLPPPHLFRSIQFETYEKR